MNKVFVFDFDGVICDSTNECMINSYNSWEIVNKRKNYKYLVSEIPNKYKKKFKIIRPYVKGAGEYFAANKIIQGKNFENINQNTYNEFCLKYKKNFDYFANIFLKKRQNLKKMNLNKWIKLHKIYKEVINFIKIKQQTDIVYIATLKDGESVKLILEYYGIKLDDKFFFDRKVIKSKIEALQKIRKKTRKLKQNIFFFDDNVMHLIATKKNNYNSYLTTWHNPSNEIIEIAKNYNIKRINSFEKFY